MKIIRESSKQSMKRDSGIKEGREKGNEEAVTAATTEQRSNGLSVIIRFRWRLLASDSMDYF
jgi:hypothetical protein